MRVLNKQLGSALVLALGLVGSGVASATPIIHPYVVKLTQQGNNVVATGSGAFDLTGMYSLSNVSAEPILFPFDNGVATLIGLGGVAGSSSPTTLYYIFTASGQPDFGTGYETLPSVANGDLVIFEYASESLAELNLSPDYSSGDALSGSATWDNASFATLGVTPGTYTWTWGSAADQSFTLDAVEAVPEPAALSMFGLGLLLIGGFIGLCGRDGRRFNKEVLS